MTNNEKAIAYYLKNDVDAYESDGKVFIFVQDLHIEVADADVVRSAHLYDKQA